MENIFSLSTNVKHFLSHHSPLMTHDYFLTFTPQRDCPAMKIKSMLAKPFASYIYKQIRKNMSTAVEDQQAIFNQLIKTGGQTDFGTDHSFKEIKTHKDFIDAVPIRDYEQLKPYIEKIKQGKH